jgi:hypothetical protein
MSVMHLSLLKEVQQAEREVRIHGAGGLQLTVSQKGYLEDIFTVYASEDTTVNILSLAEVEDKYAVMYVPQESFTVHLPDRDIVFVHQGKLCIAD